MPKEKNIFPLRMSSEITDQVKVLYKQDNCKSQNEFIEKAVKFYISYHTSNSQTSYLNPMLLGAVQGAVKESENRQASNIFRLSVEMSMMMNILAAGLEISDDDLRKMRGRCVREVKASKGRIAFEDALEYQRSDD